MELNIDLQTRKIIQKIDLITNLIETLANYNSIEGYTNQKKFTIDIKYRKEDNNPNFYYCINILRGTNEPKNILYMRFVSYENINYILENLINRLTTSDYFSHTTYSSEYGKYSSYNITLKNNIDVKLGIKTLEDLEFFNKIEERFKQKMIRVYPLEESNKTKDEIQKEKMINIIDLMYKVLSILEQYNTIEDYNNTKPFSFKIKNYYDKKKDCHVFTFTITRGNTKPEVFLTLNASIKDKKVFYNKIYDLMNHFKQKQSFLINMLINDFNGSYTILTKNSISLEFAFYDELDKTFYISFMKETDKKNNEYELNPRKDKLLKPIE